MPPSWRHERGYLQPTPQLTAGRTAGTKYFNRVIVASALNDLYPRILTNLSPYTISEKHLKKVPKRAAKKGQGNLKDERDDQLDLANMDLADVDLAEADSSGTGISQNK